MLYKKALESIEKADYLTARGLLQACLDHGSGEAAGDIHFWLGWCLEHEPTGDKVLACEHYQQVLAIDTEPARRLEAHFRSGWLLIQEAQWGDALEQLRRGLEVAESAGIRNLTFSHSVFWQAFAMETLGQYIDALEGYRRAGTLEPLLAPEAALREIICLTQIAHYEAALRACRSLGAEPPEGFDPRRFEEIRESINKERALLERCLAES